MRVVEQIPDTLGPEVAAALAWLQAERGCQFKLTGIVEPELVEQAAGTPHELSLILCEGDRCVREQLRVRAAAAGFEFSRSEAARVDPPAELDPLPGVRRGWLEAALAQHAFVVLVFYRGFW